jgi:hypothetical protein
VSFIDEKKGEFGVEPICAALRDTPARIAPSTYYVRKSRSPCARARADTELTEVIGRVHAENFGVYGQVKMHAELARMGGVQGRSVARCTVARLMRAAGLRGIPTVGSEHRPAHRPSQCHAGGGPASSLYRVDRLRGYCRLCGSPGHRGLIGVA